MKKLNASKKINKNSDEVIKNKVYKYVENYRKTGNTDYLKYAAYYLLSEFIILP